MRLVEAIPVLLAILWPLFRMVGWHRNRDVATVFVIAAGLAITLVLLAGAARWPLAPIIVLLIAWEIQAVGIMVGDMPQPSTSRTPQVVYGVLLLVLVLPSAVLPLLLLPQVPPIAGSGPYQVGTRMLAVRDTGGVNADSPRDEVTARIWFPGEPQADQRAVGASPTEVAIEPALASALFGRPWGWTVRGVSRTPIRAFTPMRLLTKQREFPVVLVSHLEAGNPLPLRRVAVALASHGFVVVEPVLSGSFEASAIMEPGQHRAVPPATASEETWRVLEAIRSLAATGSGDPLAGRLRTDQVGWVGLGSAEAVGRALADSGAVVALVSLDPAEGSVPLLDGIPELRLERVGRPAAAGSRQMRTAMAGTMPIDFTDLGRWSPILLRQSGRGGWVPAARMEAWIQGWTLAFLGVHLTGLPTDSLRALSSRFPGTTISLP